MKKLTYYWLSIKSDEPKMLHCRTIAKARRLIKTDKIYCVTRIVKTKNKTSMEKIYRDSTEYPLNKIKA